MEKKSKKKSVKALLLTGERLTAIEINQLCYTGDARKCISDLRKGGMDIKDMKIDNNGTKIYWYDGKDERKG